ncbi:hypothetical protein ANMWB30_35840 [Arthrobacter sp. MWB30]|nr:hypothetical protein ANMWB30_35840 [Arthrobacter sp. MWB30]
MGGEQQIHAFHSALLLALPVYSRTFAHDLSSTPLVGSSRGRGFAHTGSRSLPGLRDSATVVP